MRITRLDVIMLAATALITVGALSGAAVADASPVHYAPTVTAAR